MDFSKLNQNGKLAAYAAVAVVIGGLGAVFSYSTYSGTWLALIAAVGMLAILFLPQLSPTTSLPGSTGSLMLIAGAVAGLVLALLFLVNIGFVFTSFGIPDLLFLIAVVGGLVMAWAGWQEFQSEGGKFQLGSSSSASAAAASAPAAAIPSEPAVTVTDTAAPVAEEPAPEMAEAAPAPSEPAPTPEPVDAPSEDPLRDDDRPAT